MLLGKCMSIEPPEPLALHPCLAHVAVLVTKWLHLLLLCYGCWLLAAAVVEGQWQPLHAHKDQAWAMGWALDYTSAVCGDELGDGADRLASCTQQARFTEQCCVELVLQRQGLEGVYAVDEST
jgi:hypothetical protein